mgnify:CR=1 FL=1
MYTILMLNICGNDILMYRRFPYRVHLSVMRVDKSKYVHKYDDTGMS